MRAERTNKMDQIEKDFEAIIRECNYDNTYKMALAKALIDIVCTYEDSDIDRNISTVTIAEKFLEYYWNQTVFHDFQQGNNSSRTPLIVQHVKSLIDCYYGDSTDKEPRYYSEIHDEINNEYRDTKDSTIKRIAQVIGNDVAWRFTNIYGQNKKELFRYNSDKKEIEMPSKTIRALKKNESRWNDIIVYRWGLILENYINSTGYSKQIKVNAHQRINEEKLEKYKNLLGFDYIAKQEIENNEKEGVTVQYTLDDVQTKRITAAVLKDTLKEFVEKQYEIVSMSETDEGCIDLIINRNQRSFTITAFVKSVSGAGWSDSPDILRIQFPHINSVHKTTKDSCFLLAGIVKIADKKAMVVWEPLKYQYHKTNRSAYVNAFSIIKAINEGFIKTYYFENDVYICDEVHFQQLLETYIQDSYYEELVW